MNIPASRIESKKRWPRRRRVRVLAMATGLTRRIRIIHSPADFGIGLRRYG
jgi:hypothetical protein